MKSFLKFLSRNKLYTAIEAVGLAVSLAFVILIGSYVVQQYQVAHGSPNWKRTFVLGSERTLGLTYWDKEEIELNIPEVEAVTHLALMWQPVIDMDGDTFNSSGIEADADFFKVFPHYRFIEGSVSDFVGNKDILISESFARRIAKDGGSLVGNTLKVNESERTIKGVFSCSDRTLFMPFDIIFNISDSWGANESKDFNSIGNYSTWYLLRDDVDLTDTNAKVKALLHKNYDSTWQPENVDKWQAYRTDEAFFFYPNGGSLIHSGNRQMLKLLTVVVLLLLLSAIFNYVNLSLALTGKRSKEMATRRLLGAERGAILWKYIAESVAFTAVCFAVALLLAYLLAPMVDELVSTKKVAEGLGETSVKLSIMMTPGYIIAYIGGILFLGTACGLLPAFAASRFEPIDVIKGTLRRRNKMVLSRIFIVVQNVLSVFLIAMSLLMEVQMRHMLNRPTHAAVDNLFYIGYAARDYDMAKLFKDKVEQLPFVTSSGVGRGLPGMINMTMSIKIDDEHHLHMPIIMCDSVYFQLMGLEVQDDFGHPLINSLWMSQSAFNMAGVSDTTTVFPRRIMMNGSRPEYIGGIVADFPSKSVANSEDNPNGAVIVARSEVMQYANCFLIGTTGEDPSYSDQILKAYREYRLETSGVEEEPWSYGFMRDFNRKQLDSVLRTIRLVELFTILSVIIALLGLLAMSTYFADENTRQIALRKVFGADVTQETWRNVKFYMVLAGVACAIGVPLAIWSAHLYLQRFAYRIEGYGWVFAVATIISLAIAFASVIWQVIRSARTNPATELKKE